LIKYFGNDDQPNPPDLEDDQAIEVAQDPAQNPEDPNFAMLNGY